MMRRRDLITAVSGWSLARSTTGDPSQHQHPAPSSGGLSASAASTDRGGSQQPSVSTSGESRAAAISALSPLHPHSFPYLPAFSLNAPMSGHAQRSFSRQRGTGRGQSPARATEPVEREALMSGGIHSQARLTGGGWRQKGALLAEVPTRLKTRQRHSARDHAQLEPD